MTISLRSLSHSLAGEVVAFVLVVGVLCKLDALISTKATLALCGFNGAVALISERAATDLALDTWVIGESLVGSSWSIC